MVSKSTDYLFDKKILLPVIVIVFLLVRLPGVHLPLHQDEYKWPTITDPSYKSEVSIPHPPLGEFIYRTAGYVVGFNTNFRFVPLFFGAINLLLLYYLVEVVFGRKEAVIVSLVWSLSYFSVLASLMVDTDGEILPFFFLLSLISYYKLLKLEGKSRYKWGILLCVFMLLGLLVKVSFILAVGAIILDFLYLQKSSLSKKNVFKYLLVLCGAGGVFILILILSQKIFPFFNLSTSVSYWEHFATLNRGWFQTLIQCIKAILYASPALIVLPFFGKREDLNKTRVFVFFLMLAFIFYVILFDFSTGALDRYLQLIVLPLSILSGLSISNFLWKPDQNKKEYFVFGLLVAAALVFLQFLPHYVPPLHPKTEWIGRTLSLKWNFLYPFSGGSGPLGFYVSFLFIALAWIISTITFIAYFVKPKYYQLFFSLILAIGLTYNGLFIEEYLFGLFNGSAARLLTPAVLFMKNDPEIKMVTVYNDNGGYEIQQIGKYRKRLYVDPKFDINLKVDSLNKYKEHYFVLDVPRIDPNSVYVRYFNSCKVVYKETDQNMSATIYDCRNAPDIKV